jgi:hypothetical protein
VARIRSHRSINTLDPEAVLASLAQAFTAHPALAINSLSWSIVDEDSEIEPASSSSSRVSSRERLWTSESDMTRLYVELTGTVSGEQGLREQQHSLQTFVSYLEAMPGIADVTVFESPANVAHSSDTLVSGEPGYRLTLLMDSSS